MNTRVAFLLAALVSATSGPAFSYQNAMIPNVRIDLAPPTTNTYGAFAGLGEFGARNVRGSATWGGYFTPCQVFKGTAEYLTQEITYNFERKNNNRWVYQYGFGGEYSYLFENTSFLTSLDAGVAYSHANGKPVGEGRRVAGSSGGFGRLGLTLEPWKWGYLSGAANYDYVRYNQRYESRHTAIGWGGSIAFTQCLGCDFSIQGIAEFRRPFNFYEGSINWSPSYCQGIMNVGVYGNYTDGKRGLQNITTAGIMVSFAFGLKSGENGSGSKTCGCTPSAVSDLSLWVQRPAVYIPTVLSVSDERD